MEDNKSKKEILPKVLLVVAGGLVIWAAGSTIVTERQKQQGFTDADYRQALDAEQSDKCLTPDGYTDEEWREHMSHHPSRYRECLTRENTAATYQNVTPAELDALLAADEDVVLIDTHIPEQAHIPGTDGFIPFNEITERHGELPDDLDAPIVLYCRSGSMSAEASEALISLGHRNVYNLVGGTNAWKASGRTVIDEAL